MRVPAPRKIIGFTVKTDKDGNKDVNFPVEEIIALRAAGFTTEDINTIYSSHFKMRRFKKPNFEL